MEPARRIACVIWSAHFPLSPRPRGHAVAQARLELLPRVETYFGAASLSADGQLVTIARPAVGGTGIDLTRWTPSGVTTATGLYAERGTLVPIGASRSGEYIVGSAANGQFFISGPAGVTVTNIGGWTSIMPMAVSENGLYLAGRVANATTTVAFRMNVTSGWVMYGTGSGFGAEVPRHGVANNGVVTYLQPTDLAGHGITYRMDEGGSNTVLRSGLIADAAWIAQDGSAIIDSIEFGSLSRWTVQGGVNVSQSYGYVGNNGSETAVSPNAQMFASYLSNSVRIWNGSPGSWQGTPLTTWLSNSGLDLTGWTFNSVYSLTDDGRTIIGDGTYMGTPGTFVAYAVPGPPSVAGVALLGLALVRRRR